MIENKKHSQINHIIKASKNVRSEVRSNFIIPNIPVEKMKLQWLKHMMVEINDKL